MSDFTPLDENGLLPGEPWTSGKALAVYRNPIGIAAGADDAPRIRPGALDLREVTINPSGLTNVVITDLPPASLMFELETIQPATSTTELDISFSINNGSTFFGTQVISESINWQDATGAALAGLSGLVELVNTSGRVSTYKIGTTANVTSALMAPIAVKLANPFVHVNAVRFRWSGSNFRTADNQRIRVYAGGNRHAPKP